jgi:hypothetical protein
LVDRSPVIGISQPELIRFCHQLSAIIAKFGLGKYETANMVLSFVQKAIPYEKDEDSTQQFEGGPFSEYGRFAIETINDKAGDCECTSILCCAILAYLGIDSAIMFVDITDPFTDKKTGHAAVGLNINALQINPANELCFFELKDKEGQIKAKYLYGESAAEEERFFGFIPEEWKEFISLRKIVPIPPPILVEASE